MRNTNPEQPVTNMKILFLLQDDPCLWWDKSPIGISGNCSWKTCEKPTLVSPHQWGHGSCLRERNELHDASGQATTINTERHINYVKVTTYPIKKEGTPKLHPYLLAIGNAEAGDFFLLLCLLLSHPFYNYFLLPKKGLVSFFFLMKELWVPFWVSSWCCHASSLTCRIW